MRIGGIDLSYGRQLISDGDPISLTDFANDEIHDFAPVRKRLYVSRDNQIRNAILIKTFR